MKYLDYPEQQKHGSLNFPYYFYHVSRIHPRYTMPYHWHPLFEIVHVFQGRFHLQLDNCFLELKASDTVLIQGGLTHGGAPSPEEDCIYECILIDLETVFLSSHSIRQYEETLVDLLNSKIILQNYFPSSEVNVNTIILQMLELLRSKPKNYALSLYGCTYLLFGTLFSRNYYRKNTVSKESRRFSSLKSVFSLIEEHYSENLTLDILARCANLNPSYFCRYFKEFTDRTPMDYLNYYRIEVACEQLSYTDKSITEIAHSCGFSDSSYFVKVFRHYKQMTPTEYTSHKLGTPTPVSSRKSNESSLPDC